MPGTLRVSTGKLSCLVAVCVVCVVVGLLLFSFHDNYQLPTQHHNQPVIFIFFPFIVLPFGHQVSWENNTL